MPPKAATTMTRKKAAEFSGAILSTNGCDGSLDDFWTSASTSRVASSKKRTNNDSKDANASKRAKQTKLVFDVDRQPKPSGSKLNGRGSLEDVTATRKMNPPPLGLPTPSGSVKRKRTKDIIVLDSSSSPARPSHDCTRSSSPIEIIQRPQLPTPSASSSKSFDEHEISSTPAQFGVKNSRLHRLTTPAVAAPSFPTPESMPFRKPFRSAHPLPLPAFSSRLRATSIVSEVEEVNQEAREVPSSQSQHIVPFTVSPKKSSFRQPDATAPERAVTTSTKTPSSSPQRAFVESSQSQHLLPFVRSPEKRPARTGENRSPQFKRPSPLRISQQQSTASSSRITSVPSGAFTVPTSQSEEEELTASLISSLGVNMPSAQTLSQILGLDTASTQKVDAPSSSTSQSAKPDVGQEQHTISPRRSSPGKQGVLINAREGKAHFEPPAPSQALSMASSVTQSDTDDDNFASPTRISTRSSPIANTSTSKLHVDVTTSQIRRSTTLGLVSIGEKSIPDGEASQTQSYQSSVTESYTSPQASQHVSPQHRRPNEFPGDDTVLDGRPVQVSTTPPRPPSPQSSVTEYSDDEDNGEPLPSAASPGKSQIAAKSQESDLDDSQFWTPGRVQRVLRSIREERGFGSSQNEEFLMAETPIREFLEIRGFDDESQIIE
ncbi:hypothetical protein SCHPADRAFT_994312 [Schizopora paradoxa]|uniref:Uncharacterized protein n=1 Tax=Schizopora paradoxa TaxID=27342 RepID=A0A0H2SK80_9AGAM|nr:hypothetical protein SCHPADRAFT_994312 [Schizopora paradoxa]